MLCETRWATLCSDSDAATNSRKQGALSAGAQPMGWKDSGGVLQELKGILVPPLSALVTIDGTNVNRLLRPKYDTYTYPGSIFLSLWHGVYNRESTGKPVS